MDFFVAFLWLFVYNVVIENVNTDFAVVIEVLLSPYGSCGGEVRMDMGGPWRE